MGRGSTASVPAKVAPRLSLSHGACTAATGATEENARRFGCRRWGEVLGGSTSVMRETAAMMAVFVGTMVVFQETSAGAPPLGPCTNEGAAARRQVAQVLWC